MPLRQIFDDVWRTSSAAGPFFFRRLGSSHVRTTSSRTSSAEADSAVSRSRYAQLKDSDFCRGVADAGDNGSALILATFAQLKLLSSATQLYLDATLKVVTTIYQLFTLFVRFADFAFPVCYALMSRKTTEQYVKVFQKVQQLVPQFTTTCAMGDFEEASVAGFYICDRVCV